MKPKSMIALGCALALFGATLPAYAQEAAAPTTAERVAAVKASLAQSMQSLKHYQWTETTVVNLKGDDKSTKQNTCYYGADGNVVKTPIAPAAEPEGKRGLRGKIIENKKEEIGAYMQSAVALIKTYIPLDPAKIQAAKDAGNVSMTVVDPGKLARLDIKNYEKPGDNLGIQIDMTTNKILGLSVASYLTDAKDAVTLDVKSATLPDGTGFPATILLNGVSQQIKVTITNSEYKKKSS